MEAVLTSPVIVPSMQANDYVLEVDNLYKAFGDNKVLEGLNLKLAYKENLVVLGKSGSGKSVLIKCIVRLLKEDSGLIKVFGKDLSKLSRKQLIRLRQRIGFVFQSSALYDSMSVRKNLEFPLIRSRMNFTKQDRAGRIEEALDNVGLLHAIDMMPAELSGGMRKRIGLARTLIMRPDIILYDEPTTGLDPITSKEIVELMLEIRRKYQSSSIIISHDMHCVKATGDRIIMLRNGIAYAEGDYEQLSESKDENIYPFFE
jgi:phospholipid/cholesterol/gamma-HCH transport system ATP-binding protein